MKNIWILFLITIFGFQGVLSAQELNATVQIISPRLTNGDQNILQNLKNNITNFLNNTQWTNETWRPEERIQCTFVINISTWDGASGYIASAQVLSKRPVYGSTYTTTLLNINDANFKFVYTDGQTMNFSLQNGGDEITTLLGYYAYVILGIDRDTFVENGGNALYNKALTLVNNAQGSGSDGWSPSVMRNRYWLINNLTSVDMENFRRYIYFYHRDGLDLMSDNFPKAQANIIKALDLVKNINIQRNNAVFFNSYCTAKAEEIVDCMSNADVTTKLKVYELMSELDPGNIAKYDALQRNNGGTTLQNRPSNGQKNNAGGQGSYSF